MVWFKLIWFVLTNLPTIIKAIRALIGLIESVKDRKVKRQLRKEAKQIIKEAVESKNTRKLDEFTARVGNIISRQ